MKPIRLAALITALFVGMAGCTERPDYQGSDPTTAPTTTQAAPPPETGTGETRDPAGYVDLVERVGPSVVTVQRDGGIASGVVLRSDVVVTNAHVVGDQRDVTIKFADGASSPGQVLGTDTVTDLAVIRTERKNLPVPQFRTELPQAGEIAVAIGSPLGLQNSVTAGIISGLHRDIPGAASQSPSLVDLIQTDAPISPGNSGGALLDANGRVVGINEAYIPPAVGAVSLGFAIPTATVLDVAEQLLTDGTATHPYLGINIGRVTSAIQQMLGVQIDHGALVLGADPGAPAQAAGLRSGDIIIEFAGQPINTVEDLLGALRQTEPGSSQPLTFVRGGERHQVTVDVGSRSG